jgi:hypothetical protein
MTVDFSGLSDPDKKTVIGWGGKFTAALIQFVKDNPIGLARGMKWDGRTVRGTKNGDTIVIGSI